jgi:hypothetical protein
MTLCPFECKCSGTVGCCNVDTTDDCTSDVNMSVALGCVFCVTGAGKSVSRMSLVPSAADRFINCSHSSYDKPKTTKSGNWTGFEASGS